MIMDSDVSSPIPLYCPLCAKKGKKTKILPFSVNLEESIYFCSSVKCTYPFGEYLLTTVHSLPDEEQAKINEEILEENKDIEVADIIASMSDVQNNVADISFTSPADSISQDINNKNLVEDSQLNISTAKEMIDSEELFSTIDTQALLLTNIEEHNQLLKNANEIISPAQKEEADEFVENPVICQMKFSANGEPDFLDKITEEYMNISKSSEPIQTTQLILPFKSFLVSKEAMEELEQESKNGVLDHKELNNADDDDSDLEFVEKVPKQESVVPLPKKNMNKENNLRLLSASRRHIVVKRKNVPHSLKN